MDGVKTSCSIITILNLIVIPISFDLIQSNNNGDNVQKCYVSYINW